MTTNETNVNDIKSVHELSAKLNGILKELPTAQERLAFVLELKDQHVAMTTSFGIHSALMLHLVTTAAAAAARKQDDDDSSPQAGAVPVIWIDTGYLPAETYHFGERLKNLVDLSALHVYESALSPARMEALHGKLWEDPRNEAHKQYNYIRKVEPMQRALDDLGVQIVLSGLRADQTSHRNAMEMVHVHNGRIKICPILDWTDTDVSDYFDKQGLPFHPLYAEGYRSVGDWHSSKPFDPSIHNSERDTRFGGRTQECGLHVESTSNIMLTSEITPKLVLDNGGFVLYTKPSCRFCVAAKALIKELNLQDDDDDNSPFSSSPIAIQEFELGKDISRAELEQGLHRSIKTVPQILYKGQYIGGYGDLVAWSKKKLTLPNTPLFLLAEEAFSSIDPRHSLFVC